MLSEYNSEEPLFSFFLQGLQHQKKDIVYKMVGKETGKQDRT